MFNKKFALKLVIVLLSSLLLFFAVYNDYDRYQSPIVKITGLSQETEKDGNIRQTLTGTVKNGEHKGETITLENKYDPSLVYDEHYRPGSCLFVSIDSGGSQLSGRITGVKRDHYAVLVLLVLLDLLLLVGGKQGFYTIIGLSLNITLFYGMLTLYEASANVLALSIGLVILFSSIVLLLINGFNKRTLISLLATLGAVAVIGLLSAAVIRFGPAISYEFMEYLPEPYSRSEADLLFLAEILIGGLGVIMDIAVTITSCSAELIRKDPLISKKALLFSCRQVADDITGTMINVVFFTNIAACIPVFILSMKNDISFFTVMKYNSFFEIARFLTGSMGIILTIPLSIFAASCFLKGGKKKCC